MRKIRPLILFLLLATAMFSFAGCHMHERTAALGELRVFVIDCGQGDAIFVELPNGENMLVDGGPNSGAGKVLSFLNSRRIDKIDYIVATHPHEDHIGGLDDVLSVYGAAEIYMPDVTADTAAFSGLLAQIDARGLEITVPESGEYIIGDAQSDLSVICVAPNSSGYTDTNNYSIVLKIKYGSRAVLLTGDASGQSEREQLDKGFDLSADVIKIAHHGSADASAREYIEAVNPEAAVISCGAGNKYGHPSARVLLLLEELKINVYRTDTQGTVTIKTNGSDLLIN
jgi:competence protein ComEC